jgi:hypothetical protein
MNTRIFEYSIPDPDSPTGERKCFADPFEVDYRFQKASETEDVDQLNKWMGIPFREDGSVKDPSEIDKVQDLLYTEGMHRFEPLVRKAFDFPPFDPSTGRGLSGNEVLGIWWEYCAWQWAVKKNTDLLLNSAQSTDSTENSSNGPSASQASPDLTLESPGDIEMTAKATTEKPVRKVVGMAKIQT